MHYSTLAAFAVLAAPFAAAQDLSKLPQCAEAAATAGIGSTGCSLTDFKCICSAQAFIASLTTQIQQVCSASDQAATFAFAQQLCGSVGVNIPTPSLAASSTPAGSATVVTTSVPSVVSPAAIVSQISDGQPQVPTSGAALKTANATTVSTPSPSAFVGAAAGLSAQSAAMVLVGAVAVVFAL